MAKGKCFLFFGPEIGEKEDAIEKIRAQMGAGVEEIHYYAGETPTRDIAANLLNGSLFSTARLFLIKNGEYLNNKRPEDMKLLLPCLENLPENTTVILISDETSASKLFDKVIPPANRKVFWELDEGRKANWVAAFFQRQGYDITPEGIEMILELVENNTGALRQECGRLMLFLGKEKAIDGEVVEKWLSHSREESPFTLFSRMAAGDLPRSLESVRTLLASKESPIAILAGLAWCFRKLRDYLALKDSGKANDFELRKIGLAFPKVRRDYVEAGKRYTAAEPCLALIGDYDIRLRSAGALWETLLMERLVCELMAGQP